MSFDLTQLSALKELTAGHMNVDQPAVGNIPREWASQMGAANEAGNLSDHRLTRSDLVAICESTESDSKTSFLSCMAWGGMRRDHGAKAWKHFNEIKPILEDLKAGRLNRKQAYEQFQAHKVPGLGVAFFTKLIGPIK